jgi:hypothetical protein
MARTVVLQDRFDRGMVRDLPIDQLPKGAVWDMIDMLPSGKAGIANRSPWTRHSATVSGTYCAALAYAPFAAGAQIVAINSSGACKQVSVTASTVTARGTAQVPFQPPVFYREKVYIPSDNGTTVVKSYAGSSDAITATGSPPAGMFCTTYKDHLVLARDATNYTRVWFSNGGDAGVWDTAADGQWLNTTRVITGLATLNQMILVFSEEGVERIRGDIIPGVAGSDMIVEPAFNIGCAEASTVAVDGDIVVYANSNGVWLTDGIARPVDLTAECGMKTFWRDHFGGTYSPTFSLTGGIYQGHYIVSSNDNGTFHRSLCFDIRGRRAWRFTNINAAMMAAAPTTSDARSGDLFFGERDNPNVSRLGSMWFTEGYGFSQAGGSATDGNGTKPAPSFTTGYLRGRPGTKRWRRIYLTYVLEDDVSASAMSLVVYHDPTIDGLAGGASFALAETGGGGASASLRRPLTLDANNVPSDGIAVKLSLNGAAPTDFRVFLIEAEVREREQSR